MTTVTLEALVNINWMMTQFHCFGFFFFDHSLLQFWLSFSLSCCKKRLCCYTGLEDLKLGIFKIANQ